MYFLSHKFGSHNTPGEDQRTRILSRKCMAVSFKIEGLICRVQSKLSAPLYNGKSYAARLPAKRKLAQNAGKMYRLRCKYSNTIYKIPIITINHELQTENRGWVRLLASPMWQVCTEAQKNLQPTTSRCCQKTETQTSSHSS